MNVNPANRERDKVKIMKINRITAVLLSLAVSITMLAGCGDSSKDSISDVQSHSGSAADSESSAPTTLEEPDFMGYLTGTSTTDFYNMSTEEFNNATGGVFIPENALEYDDWDGIYAKYTLGKKDSILGGRLKLEKEYEIFCILNFKKDKLKEMSLRIDDLTEEEAKKICNDFLKAFEDKLPDGYEEYPPLEHGNIYEVGYVGKYDDYIASMRYNTYLSDKYYILFTLENYSERYGLK